MRETSSQQHARTGAWNSLLRVTWTIRFGLSQGMGSSQQHACTAAIYPHFTEYCACRKRWHSKITKYCACHEKWFSWSISVTYETSFTMRGATSIILQPHQILRLPRKENLIFDPRRIWNVIYNARSNKHHPPTSPNAAPATKNDAHHSLSWHMQRIATSFTMREATGITLQPHQLLRLPRKSTLQNQRKVCRKQLKRQFQCGDDSNMIRAWSEHDPNMNPNMNSSSRTRPFGELTFRASATHFVLKITTFRAPAIYPNFTKYCACHKTWHSKITKYCACHEKWFSWSISVTCETSFTMRGATSITLQPHQILRLPRKENLIFDPRHIWNVIYNARSNKHHPPTSPNAAPTKNDAHHSLSWHTQRHLQCAKQQASPSNLIKYCACHAKVHSKIKEKFAENSWSVNSNAGRFEHDPSMIRAWSERDPNLNPNMNSSSRTRPFGELIFRASEPHFVLKITTFRAPAIYPNFTKYGACHKKWHTKITKYCACHEKWFSWSISVTYETSFTMRGATSITLQPHQILRLPRKENLILENVIYNARSNKHHPPTSPNAAPATKNDAHHSLSWHMQRIATSFTMREATGKYCACHEKSHSKITKYCACHEKWHSDITKCCACHEKWHSDITKCCACHEKWHSDITKYCACHEKWDCYWTELLRSWYWAVTKLLLNCYWTELLLNCHWTVTELTCYWAVILNCYSTELLLNWAVTQLLLVLNCYWTVTELLLNWPVTGLLLN